MESLPQGHTAREGLSRGAAPPDTRSEMCEAELPGFRPAEAANDMRMSQLARTIEREIIPRLMLAHRTAAEPLVRPAAPSLEVTEDDVKHFAKLVLSHDEDVAFSAIAALRARGITIDKVFVDLLAPTARYLGHLWDDDLCNFTDVTVGLGRLQRVLRELSPALGRSVEHPAQGRRVLLLPSPGEQHTFGLVMVAEFFRRAGWDVTGGAWSAGADAAELVAAEWFDVLGFSLGAAVHLQQLATSIAAVRHATCNRDIAILVGGPLFGVHPEYVDLVGADGMTIDGREAPLLAEGLIAGHMRQHHESPG
ncbi:MAG: cobalamin B12-binding domain-containing protein [Rhizobiales bacterium]|nr:cobalamin B12-binding domain-containing protein [Rhizobacter sp.]